jgi:transcriptional regulator with XRE-family HTH domain
MREVAKRSGVSASTVQRIEDGHDVVLSHALAVAAFYGVRIGDMVEVTP